MPNRLAGVVVPAIGTALLYIGIIDSIYSAAHGADKVSIYLKAIKATIATPVFLAAGLVFAAWVAGDFPKNVIMNSRGRASRTANSSSLAHS